MFSERSRPFPTVYGKQYSLFHMLKTNCTLHVDLQAEPPNTRIWKKEKLTCHLSFPNFCFLQYTLCRYRMNILEENSMGISHSSWYSITYREFIMPMEPDSTSSSMITAPTKIASIANAMLVFRVCKTLSQ